jgi:hypothetical protein
MLRFMGLLEGLQPACGRAACAQLSANAFSPTQTGIWWLAAAFTTAIDAILIRVSQRNRWRWAIRGRRRVRSILQ